MKATTAMAMMRAVRATTTMSEICDVRDHGARWPTRPPGIMLRNQPQYHGAFLEVIPVRCLFCVFLDRPGSSFLWLFPCENDRDSTYCEIRPFLSGPNIERACNKTTRPRRQQRPHAERQSKPGPRSQSTRLTRRDCPSYTFPRHTARARPQVRRRRGTVMEAAASAWRTLEGARRWRWCAAVARRRTCERQPVGCASPFPGVFFRCWQLQ